MALSVVPSPQAGRRVSTLMWAGWGLPPFPGCLGDTQFSFRIRQCGGQRSPWHAEDRRYDSGAPVSLQVSAGCLSPEARAGLVRATTRVPKCCKPHHACRSGAPASVGVRQLFSPLGAPRPLEL